MDGCLVHYILVRCDDVPSETVHVTVQRGANYLHFQKPDGSYNNSVLDGILDSDEMLLRLDQYGEGQKTVRISLSGSTMAISKAQSNCGITLSEVKRRRASYKLSPFIPRIKRKSTSYWFDWCRREDLNLRPADYESAALPS